MEAKNPSFSAADVSWRKSSYSNDEGAECVEVADNHPHAIPVRDSKTPAHPHLLIPRGSWQAFVTHLKQG
ncbi:protein of unknown function DUF397 [Streptomyces xiamenensis]|uniref:DUF397 domain-containing protein n=1 Tax=Streptomyces xiamenensis TaxID=408015 RepID=A0A0F7FV86_9ACTN|nr:DUF397 domain-containing protein [Streptomyces xiamenensis]AKG43778.1 protein of unknown function DUF397 [Streptomyces xiamenensis]